MSDIAAENIAILEARWPPLASRVLDASPPGDVRWEGSEEQPALSVNGIRLWSIHDADAEARIQASMIPQGSQRATVYGVGGADLIRQLLKRATLKRLDVVLLNLDLFHLSLHILDHREWLNDARVSLLDGAKQSRVNPPFAVVAPCLHLAGATSQTLISRLTQHLEQPFQDETFDRREPMRRRQVEQNRHLVATDGDVRQLFGSKPAGTTFFITLAGPTLSQHFAWLRKHRREGTLIAVDGTLGPLLENNVKPDAVISVDDNRRTVLPYFEGELSGCKTCPLVYAPVVHRDILTRWPGPRLATYTAEAIYDELRETLPRAELFAAGSVAHRAVDLAVKMGAGRIMLFGADFGFPGGIVHANSRGPVDYYTNASKAGTTVVNGHGEAIPSLNTFIGYRISLEDYIARHPQVEFINCSRDGAHIQGTRYLEGDHG